MGGVVAAGFLYWIKRSITYQEDMVAAAQRMVPILPIVREGVQDYLRRSPWPLERGDPVFRGMAGSRLGILLDGQEVLGGCGGRMDPPTAYIYPKEKYTPAAKPAPSIRL